MSGLARPGGRNQGAVMKSCAILVVDDEPELRELIGRVLVAGGHRVTSAENGEQASRWLSKETFDVVVTDVIMPERDGMQVITELRRKHPAVKVIAISGGGHVSREQYLKIAKGLGAHAVLAKPFSTEELMRALRAVMEETGG